jgi:hypothetical protein
VDQTNPANLILIESHAMTGFDMWNTVNQTGSIFTRYIQIEFSTASNFGNISEIRVKAR